MARDKAKRKIKFNFLGKTSVIEAPIFGATGHTQYSGFGTHISKADRNRRHFNKLEAKRVLRGDYE